MSSGTVYPLVPSAPLTDVTGSSPLLPTPTAADGDRQSETYGRGNETLRGAAVRLLPTPMARNKGGTEVSSEGREGGRMLEETVKLLPTPMAADGRKRGGGGRWNPKSAPLEQTVKDEVPVSTGASTDPPSSDTSESTALRLSPSFVEWMMGLPQGWSDPDCLRSAMAFKSSWESQRAGGSSTTREAA